MIWFEEFNSIFFITISTIVVGAFGLSVKYCLKSKCEKFSVCCGLLHIDRRVDLETQERIREIELGINSNESKSETPEIDLTNFNKK